VAYAARKAVAVMFQAGQALFYWPFVTLRYK